MAIRDGTDEARTQRFSQFVIVIIWPNSLSYFDEIRRFSDRFTEWCFGAFCLITGRSITGRGVSVHC